MIVRILTENIVYRRGLYGEHGLSLLIEEHGKRFLFDTGQSDVYLRNARKLKADLTNLDGIILSHGHYDHCGGMGSFPKEGGIPPIYVREGAFIDKWSLKNDKYIYSGIEWKREDFGESIVFTEPVHDICDGFTLISDIDYETDFEKKPVGFYLGDEKKQDLMKDEQILVVETVKGLCLFMGCSHVGIINCIKRVQKEFPGKHIHSILAGMHLKQVSKKRMERTIEELTRLDFDYLIPVHCTGMEAIIKMKEILRERCILAEAGKKIEL